MNPIAISWRLRPAFKALVVATILIPAMLALQRANGRRQSDYERVADEFEQPERPAGFCGDRWGIPSTRPDGLYQVEWQGGWIYFGPRAGEKDTGLWKIQDPEGHVRGQLSMRDDNRDGPCEFWDVTGRRRVRGAYAHWHRVGVWTLDNVIGEGRRYVLYSPSWSVK